MSFAEVILSIFIVVYVSAIIILSIFDVRRKAHFQDYLERKRGKELRDLDNLSKGDGDDNK
jgi:hypothetical protein